MKIIKILGLTGLMLIFSSEISSQKELLKTSPLSGTWIESINKTDTIVFLSEFDGQYPVFEFKRGFRITDGMKLPDYYSGPYNYWLSEDHISLFWFLSSGSFQTYYFKVLPEQGTLRIGSFFKNPLNDRGASDTLVFIKIH